MQGLKDDTFYMMFSQESSLKERLRSYSNEKQKPARVDKHGHSAFEEITEDMSQSSAKMPPTLTHLEALITNLTSAVNGIKNDITELKTSKSEKLSVPEKTCAENTTAVQEAIQVVENESLKVKILTAIVIRQDHRIKVLENEVQAMHGRQRKANIIISGLDDIEVENVENTKTKVSSFFKDQMCITDDIEVKKIDTLGKGPNKAVVVKLANLNDKSKIFDNVSNLKGKHNARKKLFFVNNDLPEKEREQRNYFQHLIKENKLKDENDRLTIQLKCGKLFVNNDPLRQKVSDLTAQDILTLDTVELEEIHQTKLSDVSQHEEGDSEFFCFVQKVKTEKQVQQGIAKMKIKFGDANHVVTSYRLENPDGPFWQGYTEDDENGAGWRMLEVLKEQECDKIAVHVAHYHGSGKLGPRHFDIYKDLAKKATKLIKQKLARLSRVN